jgi:hypothetical protein
MIKEFELQCLTHPNDGIIFGLYEDRIHCLIKIYDDDKQDAMTVKVNFEEFKQAIAKL